MNFKKTIIAVLLLMPGFAVAQGYQVKKPDTGASVFKDWANQCETDESTKQEICYSSQTVVTTKGDLELLNIAVARLAGVDKPLLRITTPLGSLLPEGMELQIDAGEKSRLPFIFCSRIGCHVEVGVTDKFLAAIKKGNQIKLRFQDVSQRKFEVPVSLAGFTKAYNSLK